MPHTEIRYATERVGPQLGRLPWGEVFAQKRLGERIPCAESVWLLVLEPVSCSVRQGEWEEPQSNGVDGDPIELNSITLRKEIAKVHVGILRRVPTELVSLQR